MRIHDGAQRTLDTYSGRKQLNARRVKIVTYNRRSARVTRALGKYLASSATRALEFDYRYTGAMSRYGDRFRWGCKATMG